MVIGWFWDFKSGLLWLIVDDYFLVLIDLAAVVIACCPVVLALLGSLFIVGVVDGRVIVLGFRCWESDPDDVRFMEFIQIVFFPCLEVEVAFSLEFDNWKFGDVLGLDLPNGSRDCSNRGIAKGNWEPWLLLLFRSLDRFFGLFVMSDGIDSVAGDKVSECEIYPFGIFLLSYLLVCPFTLLTHSDIFTAIMGARIA